MISANTLYKQSGTSLPFKEWLSREKEKGNFIPNAIANEDFLNIEGEADCGCDKKNENKLVSNLVFISLTAVLLYSIYKYAK